MKPAGVVGSIGRYYANANYYLDFKGAKRLGHRAARRGWDAEIAVWDALAGDFGDYIDPEFTRPNPMALGAKP